MIKKIGICLIIMGFSILAFYYVHKLALDNQNQVNINEYIEETSIKDEIVIEQQTKKTEHEEIKENIKVYDINYRAVLEIPSINLKRGVVDNTENFRSINYSISVDNSSRYPDEFGNFILYAHSGNSSISYFRNLNKVNINDKVYVYYNGIKYEYCIYNKYDIEKIGTASVINSKDNKYITLITCNQNKNGYQVVLVGKLTNTTNY